MGDKWSEAFIKALKDGDTERVKQIPKADLHNHFVLGGSRGFIRERKGLVIPALEGILESMKEMDRWNQEYIGKFLKAGKVGVSSLRRRLFRPGKTASQSWRLERTYGGWGSTLAMM